MVGSRGGEAITAADADITRNTAAAVGRTILLAVDYVSLAGEDSIRRSEQLMPQLTLSPSSDRTTPIIFEVTRPGDPAPVARRQARIAETTAGVVVARDALPAATLPPGRFG